MVQPSKRPKVDITVTISGAQGVGKSALLEVIRMCLRPHIDCMVEEQTPYIEAAMEIIDREQPVVLLRTKNA